MRADEVIKLKEESDSEGRHLWNSEQEVCDFMANLVKLTKAKRILEIGVFEGETSKAMISAMDVDCYFAGIDINDFRKEPFDNRKAADFIIGSSTAESTYNFHDKFDIIFVDSMHYWEHIFKEWKIVEKWLADKGVVAYHDSIHIADVARLMNYIDEFNYNVVTLNTPDNRGLTLITKR